MTNFKNADEVVLPAIGAFEITPDNDLDLEQVTRAVYVGGDGDVTVEMADGSTVTFTAPVAGIEHPWRVKKVFATGTSATDLVGLY